jgi:hypothetical protein
MKIRLASAPLILSAALFGCAPNVGDEFAVTQPLVQATSAKEVDLFVTSFFGSSIQRFAGPLAPTPGAPLPTAGNSGANYATVVSRRPWPLARGRDGNLYTTDIEAEPGVARVYGALDTNAGKPDPAPGQTGDTFTPGIASSAIGVVIDGNFYVGAGNTVERIDARTGAVLGTFTSGYTLGPVQTLAFNRVGTLFVGTFDSCVEGPTGCTGEKAEIIKFDGYSGKYLGTYVANGVGGLSLPYGFAFDKEDNLYVANWSDAANSGTILRYHQPHSATPGAPYPSNGLRGADFTSRTSNPVALAFGPDRKLYASDLDGDAVVRYDANGVFLGTFTFVTGSPRGIGFFPSRD